MNPERWQQVSQALDKALRLKGPALSDYLAEIAAHDPDLRQEVDSLLDSHEKAGTDFLNVLALPTQSTVDAGPRHTSRIGHRLGQYQIVELIGIGGMGEVYRAVRADDQYRQQVALKLVRPGQDSSIVINRFRNERQILASLEHPNIARLLDGGSTDDGLPYFVMELIEGTTIDRYCSEHKLTTVQHLKLFLQVCSAIQLAHQRLIVHRDIKPSNILVTVDGVPKLLDFGIAKLLDPGGNTDASQPTETMTQFRAFTPGYASPEQLKGEPITTASDVYSLGVVLYELLTGRSPYGRTSLTPHEMARVVCEVEPVKPSTAVRHHPARSKVEAPPAVGEEDDGYRLSRRLKGDLDNIILMALRKEPQRRYSSVEQLAADIRRHLENLPVMARQDTVGYRASKFVARHKTGVALTVTAGLLLLLALIVTAWEVRIARQQAAIAREQRARAERRFNDVRKLANSLMFEVHDSIKNLPGTTPARKLLVSRALEYLDSLSQEAGGDSSLQRELAAAYDRVGDVLGDNGAANLGDFGGAAQSYAKALAIRESLAAANPKNLTIQIELADEYFREAGVLQNTGDFAGSLRILQRAIPKIQKIAAGQNDPRLQDRTAGLYYFSGVALEKTGDWSGALQNYRAGLSIREPATADPHTNAFTRAHLSADYIGVGKMLAETGDIDGAVAMVAKGLNLMKQLSEASPNNATFREWLAESYDIAAELQEDKGNLEPALGLNRRGHQILEQLHDLDPSNQLAMENLAFNDLSIGEILVREGNLKEGLRNIQAALTMVRGIGVPKNLWESTVLSQTYSDLGLAHVAMAERASSAGEKKHDWRAARSWYQQALNVWGVQADIASLDGNGHHQVADIRKQLANCDANLGHIRPEIQEP